MPGNVTKMLRALPRRSVHSTRRLGKEDAGRTGGIGAKGRTAGGEALGSTAPGAPQKPKVFNFSVPGAEGQLSEAQKREVDEHNREFERTHGEGGEGPDIKVDEKFWGGEGKGKKAEGRKV
ncbi:hypothetical protein NOR_01770 [Metarhizium rileyi]|uniref:Uncharacterized protein n=1 Tax=Metarhizium rileyi (strain RCEF 4871) TaxID=1649241 RepID=A0A162M114_METRR|nr:hypothetical protein NOR_01770 [Metarhizium rileyi RCEF 4871]TWU71579.1 hypothetical protein ED733_001665 [Metarhizium rileyi]